MLKLTFYNLSVQLETDNCTLLDHINNFLQKYYTKYEQKGFSQNQVTTDRLFGGKIKNEPVYMFHTNQFIHLYHYLDKLGYKLIPDEKIDKRDYKIISGDFKVRDHWKLRDYQVPVVEFLLNNPTKSKLIPIQTGKGKDQPLDAKIKIPNGWSTIGDIQVGDSVIAPDGTTTKVTGVYPQGLKPVYKITFVDGRSTECGAKHLWKIYYSNTSKFKCWMVANTLEVKRLISIPNSRVYIPLIQSENCLELNLEIDPYLLGCFIGNNYTDSQDNKLISDLKNLGLYGKYNHEKFIPKDYLLGSHNQRLKLIQGLFDANGIINKNSKYIKFSTTSYQLALDVQYLIRSLGGIATVHKRNSLSVYKEEKENKISTYDVSIRYHTPSELFTLSEKRKLINDTQYIKYLKLRIKSIEYIGRKETQCISVEHPDHLYITDDFIVTHNTFISLYTIGQINERLGVVILPQYIDKWISDIATIHEAKQSDVMVIQGSKALAALIELAKSDSLESNYYIFSTRTMQDYIALYEEDPQLCIDMYGCAPIDLFPLLGIGVMLIDETHQHYHAIFKIIIYTNVKFHIGLSATLMSDDKFITKMHKVVYPNKCIYEGEKLDRYIDVYAISYTISEQFIRKIKTKNYGSNNYSHTAFEQSITRNNDLLQRYIKLIKANIEDYYIEDYQDQDKIIIFVSTVLMATKLCEALSDFYPEFKVKRYCEEDSYEDMLSGDIIVSTPISAGTALDIPKLRVIIQTVSISSAPTNIQILGRLRKLPDRDVKFCYIYANNINKQREYHHKRVELFRPRVANIAMRQSSIGL